MSESNNLSLFEEEKENGKMDNKEDVFELFEDFEGYIFTRSEIVKLGFIELEKFNRASQEKRIKFIAGTKSRMRNGKAEHYVVNKKRLNALGLDVTKSYYQFVKGWRDPEEVELERILEKKRHDRYWEIRTYADTIDRRVEEAEALKERKRIRKLEYEMDDDRGWTKVKPGEHKKIRDKVRVRRKGPSQINEADWGNDEAKSNAICDMWQRRQDAIDQFFMSEENSTLEMNECPLIKDYELLESDDVTVTYKCTWLETNETAALIVEQEGQGIPRWKVIAVSDG